MYVYDKSRKVKSKLSLLVRFITVFLQMFPEDTTVNRFNNPEFSLPNQQFVKAQKLFRMLIHVSTLLNKTHRLKDKHGRYISQHEDYVNALSIMKDLVLYFDIRKGNYEHELLAILDKLQAHKGEITNKLLQEYSGYSKSHCDRIISLFLDRGWIIRSGGNRKIGFTYLLTVES